MNIRFLLIPNDLINILILQEMSEFYFVNLALSGTISLESMLNKFPFSSCCWLSYLSLTFELGSSICL
jgi:lipid A disaccharide synthetase